MTPSVRRCVLVLLLALLPACAPALRVMTFNVRYASDSGPNRWEERRPVMVALLRDERPDVIGTQELFQRQGDDLVRALPGYRWFGRDRRGGHADEHMGVFYRPDRLRLVEQGDFWLSDTPGRPNSISWGADLPRMATWGVFETRGGGRRRFVFLNTHFAHRGRDAHARERSAALILARLPEIAKGLPVVVAGDLNADPSSPVYAAFASRMIDVWTEAERRHGPAGTYHGFTGEADRRIDYLFVRGLAPKEARTNTHHGGSVYPSDHFPVSAKLVFGR